MNSILVYLNETPGVKIAVTALIVVAVLIIIWLLLRNIRLWYWKTDKIIGAIDDMGSRIDSIEHGMDSIKINTEKLIEGNQFTNEALLSLQEKSELLLEAGRNNQARLAEEIKQVAVAVDSDAGSGGKEELTYQVNDLEKALLELKRQKEQLEADINARIRD